MNKFPKETWIAYLATFPPRECGIATFTQDLINSIDDMFSPRIKSKVIALNTNKEETQSYPSKVIYEIDQTSIKDYIKAAQLLNSLPQVKCINIEHEYGIHGGKDGENLLNFLKHIEKPVVLTMHTVVPNPTYHMFKTTLALLKKVKAVIVLTSASQEILTNLYKVNLDKVKIIPHGIHPVNFSLPETHKKKLGLKNKIVLSTFGLLSRNKGIEYVIKALPSIIKDHPEIVYLVIGQTHPVVRRQEGEQYRKELIKLVKSLHLGNHVKFYDRYFSVNQLLQFLQATDIYISSSLDPDQSVSGTLSYALGSGCCVISTAFSQAKEIITPNVGLLVNFKDPKDYSQAILKLLNNKNLRNEMNYCAYSKTRNMLWNNVALSYMSLFNTVDPKISLEDKNLPEINLAHLKKMTDSFALLQFAKLDKPQPQYGYTLDDNARSLIATAKIYQNTSSKTALNLTKKYIEFIKLCQTETGRFINYFGENQKPDEPFNKKSGLDDANGRAVWALSTVLSLSNIPKKLKLTVQQILQKWIDSNQQIRSLRSLAFILKGICLLKPSYHVSNYKDLIIPGADYLAELFIKNNKPKWFWFEDSLTYANAVLPEALFLAYKSTKNKQYLEIAKKSLDFLISVSFEGPIYIPIGQNGWYRYNENKQIFDQQPEDIEAIVGCLSTAYNITHQKRYKNLMYKSFYWFLGNNILGKQVYNQTTGACHDGLTSEGVNLNQGAESTVSYLLARLTINSV